MEGSASTAMLADVDIDIEIDIDIGRRVGSDQDHDQDGSPACAACGALAEVASEYERLCYALLGMLESRARGTAPTALVPIAARALATVETGGEAAETGDGLRRLVMLSDAPDVLLPLEPLPPRHRAAHPARDRQR